MGYNGIKSTDLTSAAAVDELIGNVTADGIKETVRVPVDVVATQAAATANAHAEALVTDEQDAREAADTALQTDATALAARVTATEAADTALDTRLAAVEAAAVSGIKWSALTVRVRSTANVALATGLVDGTTLNGVELATGDIVFLGSQTAAKENGLYAVVATGAASRAAGADSAAELAHIGFVVQEGTVGAGEQWTLALDAADITIGTTELNFSPYQVAQGYQAEITAARGGEDTLSDALALKADTSTVTALTDEIDLKAPLDGAALTNATTATTPTTAAGLANKGYVDNLFATLPVGYYGNGTDLPDPATYSEGSMICIADGDDVMLCVRSVYGYWLPIQDFRPGWLPADMDYGVRLDHRRYFRDGVGYLPLSYAVTTDATGTRYAMKSNGYWQAFGPGELRCTDLGMWSETSAAVDKNFLRFGHDLRMNVAVQMTGGNGLAFKDDELVSWAGGGSGRLVAEHTDAVNSVYCFRAASGSFTGTATGAESGATRTLMTNTYPGWTLSGVTVTLDGPGFDETPDKGCLLEATTNGATISQPVMASAFASPQTADTYYNYNLSIQRVSGSGTVSASMDDGATYTDLDLDGDGMLWLQCPAAKLFATGATVKLRFETSGDKVKVISNKFEAKSTRSSYIPTTWNVATRIEDSYAGPIDAFQTLFTGGEFTVAMRVMTIEENTGAFFQVDDNPDRSQTASLADNRYRHDFAYKPDREDPPGTPAPGIEVGITCGVDGATTVGIDPIGFLLQPGVETWIGWSLDYPNLTLVSAAAGIATSSTRPASDLADPSEMVSTRWGSDCGGAVPLNGYIRLLAGKKSVSDVAGMVALTGDSTPIKL